MKPQFLIILALLLATAILSSCKPKLTRYELSEVDKQMIPYKLGETVGFTDSLGQLFNLIVTEDRMGEWSREDWESIERRTVILQSEFDDFRIQLFIDGNYTNSNQGIVIYVSPCNYCLTYNKEGQFVTDTAHGKKVQYSHNKLDFNNKTYNNVVEYIIYKPTFASERELIQQMPIRLFYNKTYGILQLADKDKVLFTINH